MIKTTTRTFVLGAMVALAGCAGQTQQAKVATTVVAAEQALTVAYELGDIYAKLPRCGSVGATKLCSDQAMLDKMVALGRKASAAVAAARNNEALVGEAWTAISAFQSAIPKS